MVADSANFAEVVGKLRGIWLICSNFPGFSVDGQRSETSELNMMNLVRNVRNSHNLRDMWAN